jgi:uncharacterized protein YndB with AHSA1/START domain
MSTQPPKPIEITVTHRYAASPERVFDAWLDTERAGEWLFATPGGVMTTVAIDGRVGGGFTIIERRGDQDAEHFGVFTTLDRPTRIEFSLSPSKDEEGSQISIDIAPDGQGSKLTLTHVLAPEWAGFADQGRRSWESVLDALDPVLSS